MSRFPKYLMTVFTVLRVGSSGATACADESAAPQSGGEGGGNGGTKTLSISATGVDSLPFMAILQADIDKKWFDDEGIKVDLYSGGGGGNTLRVVTSGDADLAIAGNTSVILAAQQSTEFEGDRSVVPGERFLLDLSAAGAQGRRRDVGLQLRRLVDRVARQGARKGTAGVKAQAVGAMGDNWTAAKANQITAGWAMQPFIADKQASDNAQILVNSRDVLGDLPADLVAVNADYAKANPDNLRSFFKVVDRLNQWVVSNPDRPRRSWLRWSA